MENPKTIPENQSVFASPHIASTSARLAQRIWVQWLCILIAWLCIALGILGIFIPGLPTFDFFMLAAFFAARGSQRLYHWLYHNRLIGPILQQWHQHRSIPRRAKYLSTMSMSLAALLMIWKIPHPWFVYPMILCMFCALIWLWKRPE
ncbi:YbaN family protein [Acinetobacter brisouii]|uniref:YbaN family protein n=1 Tax=Acinetobacter brisouii TaxID=396323 RepID=UPI001250A8F5|nr:YbaN family protein [Acinetobacter brisouii]